MKLGNLKDTLSSHFNNVQIDNMDHLKDFIYKAYVIENRFHLIKWKQGYYNGAFELQDQLNEQDLLLSTDLGLVISYIKNKLKNVYINDYKRG